MNDMKYTAKVTNENYVKVLSRQPAKCQFVVGFGSTNYFVWGEVGQGVEVNYLNNTGINVPEKEKFAILRFLENEQRGTLYFDRCFGLDDRDFF